MLSTSNKKLLVLMVIKHCLILMLDARDIYPVFGSFCEVSGIRPYSTFLSCRILDIFKVQECCVE